jgi:NTE family protein
MANKLVLALGGGGVRGGAHVGVLRALEREGIEVAAIAGTSIGGLVGALYLAGHTPDQLEEISVEMNSGRMFRHDRSETRNSVRGLQGLTARLHALLGDRTIEELRAPFAATAVDLHTGQTVDLRSGRALDAVLSTIAFPGIFPSRAYGEWSLIDGAIGQPLPVALARSLAPGLPVLAVSLSGRLDGSRISGTSDLGGMSVMGWLNRSRWVQALRTFSRSSSITRRHLEQAQLQLHPADLILYPAVRGIAMLDKADTRELARRGEQAVADALPQLRALFAA